MGLVSVSQKRLNVLRKHNYTIIWLRYKYITLTETSFSSFCDLMWLLITHSVCGVFVFRCLWSVFVSCRPWRICAPIKCRPCCTSSCVKCVRITFELRSISSENILHQCVCCCADVCVSVEGAVTLTEWHRVAGQPVFPEEDEPLLAGPLQTNGTGRSPRVCLCVCDDMNVSVASRLLQIMIRSIFLFLDRTYVLQNSLLPSIWWVLRSCYPDVIL